jgi:hypothetical protein
MYLLKQLIPPILLQIIKRIIRGKPPVVPKTLFSILADAKNEYVDYYGNTSLFALETFRKFGSYEKMNLLSLGTRMAHLIDYIAVFKHVYHNSMVPINLPVVFDERRSNFSVLKRDFFDLSPLQVDCVISQATIHCLNDTRYQNASSLESREKPYQVAARLKEIIGNRKIPIIISIAVHNNEDLSDGNAHLGHSKFVESFARAGFSLEECFFDFLCNGIPLKMEYFEPRYRRADVLPIDAAKSHEYVIGNYLFL